MAYVFGTSSCTMTTTRQPVFVPGVWGPYFSAMVPGAWLNEGGQSAAGAAIDHLLTLHPARPGGARPQHGPQACSLPAWLAHRAAEQVASLSDVARLAGGIHVVPEFLGNRAPFADPQARAIIAGIGLDQDVDSLTALYVAGLCGIGYGLRQIIEAQTAQGATTRRIMISGGAGQLDLVRQLLADATNTPVVAVTAEEPVLLGAAILGAVAGGVFSDLPQAMAQMSSPKATFDPARTVRHLHDARYGAFRQLQDVAREIGRTASGREASLVGRA